MRRHLLVTNDFAPKVGGIQSYLWELWRRLDPESFVVLTASSHPDARAFDAEQAARGIRIERVPGRILFFPAPASRRRIRALAEEVGAGLVLLDPALPLGLLGTSLGLPYGVVLHGAEVTGPARVPAGRQALAHVLRHASLVVSAGGHPASVADDVLGGRFGRRPAGPSGYPVHDELAPHTPAPDEPAPHTPVHDEPTSGRPLHVQIPPGVDTSRYPVLDDDGRREARRRLGLPVSGRLVAGVTRLVPRKGMDVLIEAASRLAPSYPELVVAIAGAGRDAARLGERAKRACAPVTFLGRVSEEDKALLLAASDLFVMPCRNRWGGIEQEGYGIVFVEAAAAGIPQVAGDSGGASDAVVDGETGLVVARPERPGDVAAAIRRLLADEGLRRRMGDAARRRAREELDYAVLAPKLAAALAEVQG